MGLAYVMLVVVATLLSTIPSVLGDTPSDESRNLILTSSNQHADMTDDKRQLRISGATESDSAIDTEQRIALPTGVTQIAKKLAEYIPTALNIKLISLLLVNTSPKQIFSMLKLNQLKLTENTGATLGKNPGLLEWLKYTVAYRTRMGNDMWYSNEKIYFKLLKLAPEIELAKFFQVLQKNPELKAVGHDLQLTQYNLWNMAGMVPSDLAKNLRMTKSMSDTNSIYFGYTEYWLSLFKYK